jgi:hypothetical protein
MEQETLEEVAEKYAEHQLTGIDDKFSKFECINDFIAGAKWQQEQDKNKYSEEEVIDSIKYTIDNFFNGKLAGLNSKEIFEQFKKK